MSHQLKLYIVLVVVFLISVPTGLAAKSLPKITQPVAKSINSYAKTLAKNTGAKLEACRMSADKNKIGCLFSRGGKAIAIIVITKLDGCQYSHYILTEDGRQDTRLVNLCSGKNGPAS